MEPRQLLQLLVLDLLDGRCRRRELHLGHLHLGWQQHLGKELRLHLHERCRRQQHLHLLLLLVLLLLLLLLLLLNDQQQLRLHLLLLPLCRLLLLEQLKSLLQLLSWPCQAAAQQLQNEEKLHHGCSRTGSYSCRDRSSSKRCRRIKKNSSCMHRHDRHPGHSEQRGAKLKASYIGAHCRHPSYRGPLPATWYISADTKEPMASLGAHCRHPSCLVYKEPRLQTSLYIGAHCRHPVIC